MMTVTQIGTGKAIMAARVIMIKSPPLCPCDTLLYPLLVYILPYSFPFFGRLFALYLPHVDLDPDIRAIGGTSRELICAYI